MPRLNLSDGRNHILRGILTSRGVTCKDVAKATKKPVSTVTYQFRNVDRLAVETLMMYANALEMTDRELLEVIRGERI